MHTFKAEQFRLDRKPSCYSSIFSGIVISVSMLLVAGCGGGGSTSSGGEATFTGSKTMVQGNINSVGANLSFQSSQSGSSSIAKAVMVLGNGLMSSAIAADGAVEGIEVCIESICTQTDANGSFLLDLDGVSGGTYPISFYFSGTAYTSEIDVVDDALVTLENISIGDDGIVRVNNIKIAQIDNDVTDDVVEDDVEDEVVVEDDDMMEDDDAEEVAVTKVLICHRPGTPAEKTLSLPASALKGHLGHGDTEGACTESS